MTRKEMLEKAKGKKPEDMTDEELEAMLETDDDDDMDKGKKPMKKADDLDAALDAAEALAKAESLEAELKKRDEELAKRDARLAQLEKREADRERLAKAEALVGESGIAAADVAVILEKVAGDDGATKALEAILTKADALAKEAQLFTPIGHAGEPVVTPVAKSTTARAEELRKANPKLTKAQAIAASLTDEEYEASLAAAQEG